MNYVECSKFSNELKITPLTLMIRLRRSLKKSKVNRKNVLKYLYFFDINNYQHFSMASQIVKILDL